MQPARLCVVDGTFELFRAFYGAPSRLSPAGLEIGASVALGRSLRSLKRTSTFTHYAVAFDTVIESFRNKLFAGYKTGEGIDEALHAQFPLAERLTAALGFRVLSMVEFEADDALASAAAQFGEHPEVSEIVIASPDKDLSQCVRPGVVMWDRLRDKTYDETGVLEKMGVPPSLIPDYLALVGDSADGIPGVPRWGAKSATATLNYYGHLEEIPRHPSNWNMKLRGLDGLLEELRAHEKEVLLYRTLATLRKDVPLGFSFEELLFQGPDVAALAAFSEELGVSLGG